MLNHAGRMWNRRILKESGEYSTSTSPLFSLSRMCASVICKLQSVATRRPYRQTDNKVRVDVACDPGIQLIRDGRVRDGQVRSIEPPMGSSTPKSDTGSRTLSTTPSGGE